ncbi:MAG: hypothetical protein QF902_02875 [Rhodospirillales bacterium]|jgi:hypothetical protein|nr:hypothetical protein [Rhodospirillales bacterium]
MPFVRRDQSGKISAAFNQRGEDDLEEVAIDDPELTAHLTESMIDFAAAREWMEPDLAIARVTEDLIELLIEKGVFRLTDTPEAAQNKLMQRRGLRKTFAYVENLFADPDDDPSAGESPEDEGESYL